MHLFTIVPLTSLPIKANLFTTLFTQPYLLSLTSGLQANWRYFRIDGRRVVNRSKNVQVKARVDLAATLVLVVNNVLSYIVHILEEVVGLSPVHHHREQQYQQNRDADQDRDEEVGVDPEGHGFRHSVIATGIRVSG